LLILGKETVDFASCCPYGRLGGVTEDATSDEYFKTTAPFLLQRETSEVCVRRATI
jgi:hypothetical protein